MRIEFVDTKHWRILAPTREYRLMKRGGQLYIVPRVGTGFSKDVHYALLAWLRDAGYFASTITVSKIAVSETSNSPSIDMIEDGVEEQKFEKKIAKDTEQKRKSLINHDGYDPNIRLELEN